MKVILVKGTWLKVHEKKNMRFVWKNGKGCVNLGGININYVMSNKMKKIKEDLFINFDCPIDETLMNTPIYKIFPLDKFLISLSQNGLYFIKPRAWEDPFEGFLLNQFFWKENNENEHYQFEKLYKERFYCQCWTFRNEADFQWRTYAPNKDGIMVKSTIKKIYNYINGHDSPIRLGKVKYLKTEEIKTEFNSIELQSDYKDLIRKSLLVKRTEYFEEQELRLIWFDEKFASAEKNSICTILKDKRKKVKSIFDELLLDPRIESNRCEDLKRIINKLGYKGEINRSKLYEKPSFKTIIKEKG